MADDAILRQPEVSGLTQLSRTTLYHATKRGEFPSPVKLGKRAVGWRRSDVLAWIKSREPKAA